MPEIYTRVAPPPAIYPSLLEDFTEAIASSTLSNSSLICSSFSPPTSMITTFPFNLFILLLSFLSADSKTSTSSSTAFGDSNTEIVVVLTVATNLSASPKANSGFSSLGL